jgi:hypothetical protein
MEGGSVFGTVFRGTNFLMLSKQMVITRILYYTLIALECLMNISHLLKAKFLIRESL